MAAANRFNFAVFLAEIRPEDWIDLPPDWNGPIMLKAPRAPSWNLMTSQIGSNRRSGPTTCSRGTATEERQPRNGNRNAVDRQVFDSEPPWPGNRVDPDSLRSARGLLCPWE
jgi:hypothetical protein